MASLPLVVVKARTKRVPSAVVKMRFPAERDHSTSSSEVSVPDPRFYMRRARSWPYALEAARWPTSRKLTATSSSPSKALSARQVPGA